MQLAKIQTTDAQTSIDFERLEFMIDRTAQHKFGMDGASICNIRYNEDGDGDAFLRFDVKTSDAVPCGYIRSNTDICLRWHVDEPCEVKYSAECNFAFPVGEPIPFEIRGVGSRPLEPLLLQIWSDVVGKSFEEKE